MHEIGGTLFHRWYVTVFGLAFLVFVHEAGHFFSALQPWLPQTLWLCGALLLLAGRFR